MISENVKCNCYEGDVGQTVITLSKIVFGRKSYSETTKVTITIKNSGRIFLFYTELKSFLG